jgi:broad specificity phosphatase PhoE
LDESLEKAEAAKAGALGWIAPRTQQIFAGPELRTQQTALALGLNFVVADELRDCNYGRWSGLDLAEIQEREPDKVMAWLMDTSAAPHEGESIAALIGRVGRWVEAQHDAGHTIAVTHPTVVRAAVLHALDAPQLSFWRIDIAPLTLTDLRFNGRAWTLRSSGCAFPTQSNDED